MTKEQAVRIAGLENETFDYALPQSWVNEMMAHLSEPLRSCVVANFVWLYDKDHHILGRPASLSPEGNQILAAVLMKPGLCLDGRMFEDKFLSAFREACKAINKMSECWDEDRVVRYPGYMPDFDEFRLHFALMFGEYIR